MKRGLKDCKQLFNIVKKETKHGFNLKGEKVKYLRRGNLFLLKIVENINWEKGDK